MSIDWDAWRRDYDDMSFQQHQAFNQMVALQHPVQQHWNADACARFLDDRRPWTVLEIGGWDGSLAAAMLDQCAWIHAWTMYDITDVPQVCTDDRYWPVVLTCWPWHKHLRGDALVLSHVVEHMRVAQLERLIKRFSGDAVYIDAPLPDVNPSWEGYEGTHILEVGALELASLLAVHGYAVERDGDVMFASRALVAA